MVQVIILFFFKQYLKLYIQTIRNIPSSHPHEGVIETDHTLGHKATLIFPRGLTCLPPYSLAASLSNFCMKEWLTIKIEDYLQINTTEALLINKSGLEPTLLRRKFVALRAFIIK